MALPVKTTADDVRDIVKYLKTKPTGASPSEAKAAVNKRVLDGRKLSAYRAWGFIARDAARLKLTERGWTMAREPSREAQVFRAVLDGTAAYRSVLEWINHQELTAVTTVDVGVHWHEHHKAAVGDANDNTLRENAVCFFNLAQAAGFGKMTIGRGGKPTRLDADLPAIRSHIESGPPPELDEQAVEEEEVGAPEEGQPSGHDGSDGPPQNGEAGQRPNAIFVGHGKNKKPLDQLKATLDQLGIPHKEAVQEPNRGRPIPQKVKETMEECGAAILIFSADEEFFDSKGDSVWKPSENVAHELGAASVLYDNRIIIFKEEGVSLASNFSSIGYISFEKDKLDAKVNDLLRELLAFKILKLSIG